MLGIATCYGLDGHGIELQWGARFYTPVHTVPGDYPSYGYRVIPGLSPLNAELNPICHLLALLGAHHILHFSRIRVKPTGAWS